MKTPLVRQHCWRRQTPARTPARNHLRPANAMPDERGLVTLTGSRWPRETYPDIPGPATPVDDRLAAKIRAMIAWFPSPQCRLTSPPLAWHPLAQVQRSSRGRAAPQKRGAGFDLRRIHGLPHHKAWLRCIARAPAATSGGPAGAARSPRDACTRRTGPDHRARIDPSNRGRRGWKSASLPATNACPSPHTVPLGPCGCSSPERARAEPGACVACCIP